MTEEDRQLVIKRINEAHGHSDNKLLNAFNGKSALENYIVARLTNQNTIRLLLYEDQLEQEEQAIANEIIDKAIKTLNSLL